MVRRQYIRGPYRAFTGAIDTVIRFADQRLMGMRGGRLLSPGISDPAARYLADAALLIRQFPRVTAWRIATPRTRLVFIGSAEGCRLAGRLFFDDDAQVARIDRYAQWALGRYCDQQLEQGAELVICESSRLQSVRSAAPMRFTVPAWINQVIRIPDKLDDAVAGRRHRGHRYRINRFLKEGYTFHHTHSPDAFDDFYHNMYVPFARSRHGNMALVAPYELQRWWFTHGGLLLVCRDGEPVAGSVSYISNGTCMAIEAGVRNADPELLKQGINAFLVWCHLSWAQSRGARFLNMGGTRPWRSNGSFRAKQEWGAKVIQRRRPYPVWRFFAHELSSDLQRRINQIGFIAEQNGAYLGVHVAANPDDASTDMDSKAIDDGLAGSLFVPASPAAVDGDGAAAALDTG